MALNEGESADTRETLVEGYVVDHGLVWDAKLVKSHSVGGFLNLALDERQTMQQPQQQRQRPPKVSVTLSEYLSAASPNADPSCDFGWFTPTASASSLLAADSQDGGGGGGAYPAPSPTHARTTFLFPSTRVDSGKTASLSPESGDWGNVGEVGAKNQRSLSAAGAAPAEDERQQQARKQVSAVPAFPWLRVQFCLLAVGC